jgi:hypothetical protein
MAVALIVTVAILGIAFMIYVYVADIPVGS